MANLHAQMDGAAQEASEELERLVRNMPDEQLVGVGMVLDWINKYFGLAGYKRLVRLMRERIPPHIPPDVSVL